jgi:alpha/beta superfamily hydrolase
MTELLHRSLFLNGPAGRLEALLWDAPGRNAALPSLAALVCHPHPLFSGTMHNKVVYQAARTLHKFGLPVLRFNFRGTGMSDGTHDKGHGEQEDVRVALDYLASEYPESPLLLAGFSFGAWVGLQVGCGDARVAELIGLGMPVGGIGARAFAYLESCAKPKLLVSGEFDEYGPPATLQKLIGELPGVARDCTRVVIIPGGDHFFAGHLPELDETISEWLMERHPKLRLTNHA